MDSLPSKLFEGRSAAIAVKDSLRLAGQFPGNPLLVEGPLPEGRLPEGLPPGARAPEKLAEESLRDSPTTPASQSRWIPEMLRLRRDCTRSAS